MVRKKILQKLIKINNMENNILLMGYKKNAYKYIYNSEALISASNYEDPGFVIYEGIYLNKAIISSDCNNGPKELKDTIKNGYFFQKKVIMKILKKIFLNMRRKKFEIKINSKKFCKNFTLFRHNLVFSNTFNLVFLRLN